MQTIKPEKIITTISNLKTGEVYKTEDEWKAKGVPEAEIRRDVQVIMPSLDLFPKPSSVKKMSIIRSNIARQLLAEGGAPRTPFSRGGRDRDVQMSGVAPSTDYSSFGEDQEADVARMEAAMNINQPPGSLSDEDAKALSYVNFNRPTRTPDRFSFGFSDVNPFPLITAGLTGIDNFIGRVTKRDKYNLARRTDFLRRAGVIGPGEEDEKYTDEFLTSPEGLDMLRGMGYTTIQDIIDKGRGEGGDSEPIKDYEHPLQKKEEPKKDFDDILKFYGAKFARGGRADVESQYGADTYGSYSYDDDRNRGDDGPPNPGGGGGGQEMIRPAFVPMMAAEKPGIMDRLAGIFSLGAEEEDSLAANKADVLAAGRAISDKESPYGKALTASGGPPTDVPGMSKADAIKAAFDAIPKADGGVIRQNYGLGSIVKKATRAVKKVAKSPIGKAALFAGIGAYGLGAGPFKGVAGSGFLKGPLAKKLFLSDPTKGFALANINPYTAILGTSLAAGLLSKEDEEDEKLPTQAQSDPEFQKLLAFYGGPRRFAEGGGDIEDAPMKAKPKKASYGYDDAMAESRQAYDDYKKRGVIPKTMTFEEFLEAAQEGGFFEMADGGSIRMAAEGGMMDLGGNEMDLRGGGFVPLGAKEKADDVPARLSKNEFVMTADAVRAAGGGSVDRGADIMYKTMKTLENKVA